MYVKLFCKISAGLKMIMSVINLGDVHGLFKVGTIPKVSVKSHMEIK